jgi:MacB-like periplasmic core domain
MIAREARRFLRSSPLLMVSAAAVLALGIGASALTLALLLAFSSLTYPGMRTSVYATIAEEAEGGGSVPIAWRRFEELRTSSGYSPALAAYSRPIHVTLGTNRESRPLTVAAVSRGFFPRMTGGLTVGRDFSSVEEVQAGRHAAILSYSLAVDLFKSPQNAVGRFVVIEKLPYEVAGVAPRGFRGIFGEAADAWVPANCVIPLILMPPSSGFADPDAWKDMGVFYGIAAADRASRSELNAELSRWLPLRTATGARCTSPKD